MCGLSGQSFRISGYDTSTTLSTAVLGMPLDADSLRSLSRLQSTARCDDRGVVEETLESLSEAV